eukprot:SAG22_NODE_113_length_19407_cov_214.925161_3_plen_538_part_00
MLTPLGSPPLFWCFSFFACQPEPELDLGFPRIADQLKDLKLAYDQGSLEQGRAELDERKSIILGEAASPVSPPVPGSPTAPQTDLLPETTEDLTKQAASSSGDNHSGGSNLGTVTVSKRRKGRKKADLESSRAAAIQTKSTTVGTLPDEVHTISRYFETSPRFAAPGTTTKRLQIAHRFEIGDYCILAPETTNLDGCLSPDEIGEIKFDLSGYTDDSIFLQVCGPRGDTWWYAIADIVDGRAAFDNKERERLTAEAAELALLAAAEAEELRVIAEEDAAIEAEKQAAEQEAARIVHEEEQAQVSAHVFADETDEAHDGTESEKGRQRTKTQIAGKATLQGTKLGVKATYHVSKAALKTTKITAEVTYQVATDDRTHQVAKGLARASATTAKYSVKGTTTVVKHATPALYDATKFGTKGAMAATTLATKAVVSSAKTAMIAGTSRHQSSSDDHSEFSESLDLALTELEGIHMQETIQHAVQDELVKLRWLVDEEVITEEEMHRQANAIQVSMRLAIFSIHPDEILGTVVSVNASICLS